MHKDLIAHGMATAGVAATLVVFFLLAPVSPGTGSSFSSTSSFSPTMAGLELHLSLNATAIVSGRSVALTVWVYNPSAYETSALYSGNWAIQGMGSGPCGPGNYPMGFVIMKGNLTLDQARSGQPLDVYGSGLYACPMILMYIQSYAFSPTSSVATLMGSCSPSACLSGNMSVSMSFSGVYGALGFTNFAPGSYTVVGGDEWGGVTLLHFSVTS